MCLDEGISAAGKPEAFAQHLGENVGNVLIEILQRGKDRAANLAGAKGTNGFVNGDDPSHFGRVHFAATEKLEGGIDHFSARRPQLINFHFAVKN